MSNPAASESPQNCPPPPQTTTQGRLSLPWLLFFAAAAALFAFKVFSSPQITAPWSQGYDPLRKRWLSTLCAAIPVLVLLCSLAFFHVKAHYAALLGLAASLACAIWIFSMPARMAAKTVLLGSGYGLFPIGWIILNVIFLYQLTCDAGLFKALQESLMGVTQDRRLQLILIAFCFGSFFEGAAGFGTPVAITAAILIGLGFRPLDASAISLIANTAPVAYGSLGTPLIALQGVTGLDLRELSAQAGRILPFFAVLVPFWMTWAFAGFRGMLEVWPAALVAGIFFAIPQFLISNFHGPWLVDVVSAVISMAAFVLFLQIWKPKQIRGLNHESESERQKASTASPSLLIRAWLPWLILSLVIFSSGLPSIKSRIDKISSPKFPVAGLNQMVNRVPPVVAKPTSEPAIFTFNWLTATGSGIFVASWISGIVMGFTPWKMLKTYAKTFLRVRFSLLTIAAMMALGFLTRYSGLDATMGLAFAKTGVLYPFFGTLLGWLGVALTGSDTASNVLFGSLQKISAQQIGISPTLMAAANSSGGVMGKMIDAQSIVVASTATEWYGHEGHILRYVFFHSLALAALVGLFVTMQAYLPPFTHLVVR